MSNEHTKKQIKDFVDRAIEKFKNPDKREELKRERQKRTKKVLQRFGL
jgi:hypothetical protein